MPSYDLASTIGQALAPDEDNANLATISYKVREQLYGAAGLARYPARHVIQVQLITCFPPKETVVWENGSFSLQFPRTAQNFPRLTDA
jgi:hypothetical protein